MKKKKKKKKKFENKISKQFIQSCLSQLNVDPEPKKSKEKARKSRRGEGNNGEK